MAHSKSAVKRIRINKRNRLRNRIYKSTINTTKRKALALITNGEKDPALVNLSISKYYSVVDKAVKRGVLKSRTAARKKSSLVKLCRISL
jgi:small subunit ribosomal protein S20